MSALHALVEHAAGQGPETNLGLPDGVTIGVTWGVSAVILGVGAVIDVLAFKRMHPTRMAAAALVYFSGWLSLCIAVHSPEWWAEQLKDPNQRLLIQFVVLLVNVFVGAAIFGLIIGKVTPMGTAAHDKVGMSSGDSKKAKVTGSVVGWTFAAAWSATSIPTTSWIYSHVVLGLAWPGNHIAGYLVHQIANGLHA